MGCLGRGGGSCHDRGRRVVAAAAGGYRRNGRGSGVDDRANGRKHHARRRPACNPRDLARRLCSDLLQRHRSRWQWRGRAGTALERAHARTRTHRRFQKPRILVSGLAVVRLQRRDQSEEDACAGRRAGNCRKRRAPRWWAGVGATTAPCWLQERLGAGRGCSSCRRLAESPSESKSRCRRTGLFFIGRSSCRAARIFWSWPPASRIEESEIYLATLRDGRAADPVLLMKNATAVRYTPAGGGRILFVRNDNLYAQTLNRTTRTLEGGPELIQQRVASSPSFYAAHFSVSRTGVVAWRPGTAGLSQVTIFDREGKEIGTAGPPTVVQTLRLAPDETRLLVGFNATAWLLEPGRPGRQQLEQGDLGTLWSPEGSKLIVTDPRKRDSRHGTLCYRARDSPRVGKAGRNVVCGRHFSER